ncbi:uncharacterized protein LOC129890136 [Solanum dulcamara]|uniref:uncharacterized protein LOC129890136 n=1 Tax=Solanum dulcamara TaxID=45834 RepID=UPI002485DADA|nr:uncharacterized protein LOC129890136 [Solanum dulcamara]
MIQNSASFDEDEIEVSNILLNLKDLIEESESRSKRRRCDRNLGFNSPSPNFVQRNSQVEEDESGDVEIEPKFAKLKLEKTNPNQISRSKAKTREELTCNIEKLTQCRELLRGELKKVQSYYNNQKAYNLELKAIREKVMTHLNGQEAETSHMLQYPMGSSSAYGLGSVNHTGSIGIQYPMGQLPQAKPMFSSANGLGFVNYTGPVVGIPNHTVSPFEHNRDIAERKPQYTEARRKRRI